MSTLTTGAGQQFATIAAAVDAAQSGDTIDVQAGTYTNDWVNVSKSITLNAVGGVVTMNATVQPPNGKAIIDEGAAGVVVNINGFAFTGATVADGNGAGIRYEGGTLNITNSHFYNNQDGILGAADPNGVISVSNSEFDHNGTGDGRTHNMYIGDIAQFTLTNSYTHDASVGHEIKSRAEANTITNNRILDLNSTSSYEIDLPNGGNAVVSGNTIQQGPNSQNPNIIAYGEEGSLHAGTSLSVTGNTIINDMGRGAALWNAGSGTATFANNSVYGFGSAALVSGAASQSGTTVLASRPTLDTSAVSLASTPVPTPTPAPIPIPTSAPTLTTTGGLVLSLSEDAYQGDAQYTISVDGQQVGGVRTETMLHSSGQSEQVALASLSTGSHQIAVTFLNDAYAGTPSTDRNLYLNSGTYNGQTVAGSTLALMSAGAQAFAVIGDVAPISTLVATTPTLVTTGGLVLSISEDAYQGDAQYTVSVDGQQIGGTRTATAAHVTGQSEQVSLGALGAGPHQIGVDFLNDKWDGTPSTDRNLYVDGATYDGQSIGRGSLALMSAGTRSFTATGTATPTPTPAPTPPPTPPSGLVVNVSEDAYQGDAQFTIEVDGQQIGDVHTATALHDTGQSQAVSVDTVLGSGAHTISISFINDKWDGTPTTDRNLYVDGASYNGQSISGSSATLMSNGTANFGVTTGATVTSTAVVNISEDAYQGDAQFTIAVDGQQMGGTYTATALHDAGQSQAITLAGIAENLTPHDIAVTFLNDKWDGTPSTDRNLYVNSIQLDGQNVPGGTAALMSAGTQHFAAIAPANWIG